MRIRIAIRRATRGPTGGRRWILAVLFFFVSALAGTGWWLFTPERAEGRLAEGLGALFSASARVGTVTSLSPLALEASGIQLEEGRTVVAGFSGLRATLRPGFFLGRGALFGKLSLASSNLGRSAVRPLLALLCQPVDRLPGEVELEARSVALWEGPDSRTVGPLRARLTHGADGIRRLELEAGGPGPSSHVSGTLRPAGGGALRLDLSGSATGPFEFETRLPGGRAILDGVAQIRLEGLLKDRAMSGFLGRIDFTRARFAHPYLPVPLLASTLGLLADDASLRLEETTLEAGSSRLRLRADWPGREGGDGPETSRDSSRGEANQSVQPASGWPGKGRPVIACEIDRIGAHFPAPPAPGARAWNATLTVSAGWPASAIKLRFSPAQHWPEGDSSRASGRLEGSFDLVDLRLSNLWYDGSWHGQPCRIEGAITLPPWDPRNPLLTLEVDLPWINLDLGGILKSLATTAESPAVLGFRGSVRGPLRAPSLSGHLRLTRGPLRELSSFSARIQTRPGSARESWMVKLSELSARTTSGRSWRNLADFELTENGGRWSFASPAGFRADNGEKRAFAAGALVP